MTCCLKLIRSFSPGFVNEAKVTFRLSARHAAKVLTVSQFSKSEICRHYQVDPAKVQVTYNGVDGSRFFPGHDGEDLVRGLGLEPGGYILVVGRLEPRKNHLQLIDAWVEMGASAPPLVIVARKIVAFLRLSEPSSAQPGEQVAVVPEFG